MLVRLDPQLLTILAPSPPSRKQSSPDSLKLAFERLTDPIHTYAYKMSGSQNGQPGTEFTTTCDAAEKTCVAENLLPGRKYRLQLMACFTPPSEAEICGSLSTSISDWTSPSSSFLYTYLHLLFSTKKSCLLIY